MEKANQKSSLPKKSKNGSGKLMDIKWSLDSLIVKADILKPEIKNQLVNARNAVWDEVKKVEEASVAN